MQLRRHGTVVSIRTDPASSFIFLPAYAHHDIISGAGLYLHMRTANRRRRGHESRRRDTVVASPISQTIHPFWIRESTRRRSPWRRLNLCARVVAATQILDFASLDREGVLHSGSDEGPMVAVSSFVGSVAAALSSWQNNASFQKKMEHCKA